MRIRQVTLQLALLSGGAFLGLLGTLLWENHKVGAVVLLGIVSFILIMYWLAHDYLWPDCSEWKLTSNFLEETRYGKDALRWTSPDMQKEGDSIMLDMRKRRALHNDRVLKELRFWYGTGQGEGCPESWTITVTNQRGALPGFHEKEGAERHPGDGIYIEFNPPQKVGLVIVTIKKPRINRKWGNKNIELQEVRFPIPIPFSINRTLADKL